jgi:hypothetical protein
VRATLLSCLQTHLRREELLLGTDPALLFFWGQTQTVATGPTYEQIVGSSNQSAKGDLFERERWARPSCRAAWQGRKGNGSNAKCRLGEPTAEARMPYYGSAVSVDRARPRSKLRVRTVALLLLVSDARWATFKLINRRSGLAVCERPRAPLDPGSLRRSGRSYTCSRAFPSVAGNEIPQRRGFPG